ncbi:MAG: enoyl-CoA hydratase/isomerase family protein [Burkholderiaceae bacterium]|jgi:enoyl-CoA hydratase/carnithine racemase|nr:enoyl-CoA hydratase/isomerase family protein [Burkholderiaceae bacterium]
MATTETTDEDFAARPDVTVVHSDMLATVTLNRPDNLNAITKSMWKTLGDIFRELSANPDVRCVVLRGHGTEAFSAGCDISEFASVRSNKMQAIEYGEFMHGALDAINACPHPLVACVYGSCVGAGLEILSLCDIRLSAESGTFGAPLKSLGLVMAYPELSPLLRLVGQGTLLEILLEGRILSSEEALGKNLVTRVIPDDLLEEELASTARHITSGAPLAARWHKKFVRRLLNNPAALTPAEKEECFDCFETEDFRLGCAAFLLKDAPVFKGK